MILSCGFNSRKSWGRGVGSPPEPRGRAGGGGAWLILWDECALPSVPDSQLPFQAGELEGRLEIQEGGGSGSHTHFKTDVRQLTPSQNSRGRK